ncbi:MAG: ATP-binding protein [Candidatus Anstonellales archaeon]
MNSEEVKEYLLDFQKREIPEMVERELRVDGSGRIVSIIGPRRAGKTFFMYQKMKELIHSGKKKSSILYLNFEDPRLIGVNFKDIKEIVKLHWQLYPDSTNEQLYIFVDEPQNVEGWEVAVRGLHDDGFVVFLSGSSSKLLSREIATSLRGRTISYTLLPFSFREFMRMKKVSFDTSRLGSKEKALLNSLFEEYVVFGGFPEVIKAEKKEEKERILSEYFDLVVYRDIVERYKVKNAALVKWLIKSTLSSFSKELSIHKLYLNLRSQGLSLSKNTLYSYFSMLVDSLFVFPVFRFSYSIRKRELSKAKVYACDVGFTKLVEISPERGRKMENIVFLELMRRKKPLEEIFYWKNPQNKEVDFVVREGSRTKKLIQVCSNISDMEVKKREVGALIKASEELRCSDLSIITDRYTGQERVKRKKISFVSLPEWLLS